MAEIDEEIRERAMRVTSSNLIQERQKVLCFCHLADDAETATEILDCMMDLAAEIRDLLEDGWRVGAPVKFGHVLMVRERIGSQVEEE